MFGHGGHGPGLLAGVIAYKASKKLKERRKEERAAELTRRKPPAAPPAQGARPASAVLFAAPGPTKFDGRQADPYAVPAYPDGPPPLDPRYQAEPSAVEAPSDQETPFAPPPQDWRPAGAPTPFSRAKRAESLPFEASAPCPRRPPPPA
jgi:hypothetical protein